MHDSLFPPLAERMRPRTLDDCLGQDHLLGHDGAVRKLFESGAIPSLLFWGPPGTGKTTIARVLTANIQADFHQLSAVTAGVADVKKIIELGRINLTSFRRRTILFIDEIHRFNKAQQDVLLQSVEEGIIIFIGATTENPSFEVIGPLLSRCLVYRLEYHTTNILNAMIDRALSSDARLQSFHPDLREDARRFLITASGGDARILLNNLESAVETAQEGKNGKRTITREHIETILKQKVPPYDKKGEYHYDMISAFIKSVRGSDPDAALYWMVKMLRGGEDPKFIARRLIILASEDIGNADPYAITLAASAFTAVTYVGMPEGEIVLAQAVTYLASCPKSNRSYMALRKMQGDVKNEQFDEPVPMHLRNAPTTFMKREGYSDGYIYPHDHPGHFADQAYLPPAMENRIYYEPGDQGVEKKLKERLMGWWKKRRGGKED